MQMFSMVVIPVTPYLRVYHVEHYVIHHHAVLHGGSRGKIFFTSLDFIPQVSTV